MTDPVRELADALRWALYWIARTGSVPLGGGDDLEHERWRDARRALKRYDPDVESVPMQRKDEER